MGERSGWQDGIVEGEVFGAPVSGRWPGKAADHEDADFEARRLTAPELNSALHDAWLDLDQVSEEAGVVRIEFELEQLRGRRKVKQRATLFVRGSVTRVEDDEHVGLVPVREVRLDNGVLRIEGDIPGRVYVATPERDAELRIGRRPVAIRRWFGWRSV